MKFARIDLDRFVLSFGEIIDYLSDKASPSIAQRLLDEVEQQLEGMLDMPNLYPVYDHDFRFRKMHVIDWNYTIFYVVDAENEQVVIYDMIHHSQNTPAILQERFPKS